MAKDRVQDIFIPSGDFDPAMNDQMLNLKYGGMFGFAPDYGEWVSNQAYVRHNLILVVLEAPKFMSLMRKPQVWYDVLRAFVETHPTSVEGFDAGLEANVIEQEAGGGGEMQQDFTNVTRARTNPVFNFSKDKGNAIITKFIEAWMLYGLMDPVSKIPLAITLPKFDRQKNKDWLGDQYSMTFIAFEPTATMNGVVNAWLCTNAWPFNTGPIAGSRNMSGEMEAPSLSIPFTSLTEYGPCVAAFAKRLLMAMNFTNANPNNKVPFTTEPDAAIKSSDVGYKKSLTNVSSKQCSSNDQGDGGG